MSRWSSQFANDPEHDFSLYLELADEHEPQGKIERGKDGELYFSLFECPSVRVPLMWLVSLVERARTLPLPESSNSSDHDEST